MYTNDVLLTVKAIELLACPKVTEDVLTHDGIKNTFINAKGEPISRCTDGVQDFAIELEEDLREFLNLYSNYLIRYGRKYKNPREFDGTINLKLSKDVFIKTVQQLYKLGVTRYEGMDEEILDPELQQRLEAIDSSHQYFVEMPEAWKDLSIDSVKNNFNVLTAINYANTPELMNIILSAYSYRHNSFLGLDGVTVYDNRVFIKLSQADKHRFKKIYHNEQVFDDMKYIVISKNLYDYYFCSYGSAHQSCFALNSSHHGYHGMIPFGTASGHFIIYGTKEAPQKTSLIQGCKWTTPYMYFRMWGWLGTDKKIHLDKMYYNYSSNFEEAMKVIFERLPFFSFDDCDTYDRSYFAHLFSDYPCKVYMDSLRMSDNYRFSRRNGTCSFRGSINPYYCGEWSCSCCTEALSNIQNVAPNFNPTMKFKNNNGYLFNSATCPITGLDIELGEKQSKYAKYFTTPLTKPLMVLTYIDGVFRLDQGNVDNMATDNVKQFKWDESDIRNDCIVASPYFSNRAMPIKMFKEKVKGIVKKEGKVVVLVRYVEDDKVTYVKYR